MKRPKSHVMEDQSALLLRTLLPPEWIVRPVAHDYGVDFEVELVDQDVVSGNRIWIQLKAIQRHESAKAVFPVHDEFKDYLELDAKGKLSVEYIPYPLEAKDLQYALACAFPLLLFLADLDEQEIYWIPIRDEILGTLYQRNPRWEDQKTATLNIPIWNRLSWEGKNSYPGLRWYAYEPARMYAFAIIHYYHHEFGITGRLSGYQIGDGWIDHGEELELKTSLISAQNYIAAALKLDVLFGEQGIDFFRLPIPSEDRLMWGLEFQLEQAVTAAREALVALDKESYTFADMSVLLAKVSHGIELLSTAISMYQGFRQKFLLTEATAVWRAAVKVHGIEGPPINPVHRQGYKGSNEP
jgi:hypothetical protein